MNYLKSELIMDVRLEQLDYLLTYAPSQNSPKVCPLDKDSLCKVISQTNRVHLRSKKYIYFSFCSAMTRHCSSLPDLLQGLISNILL